MTKATNVLAVAEAIAQWEPVVGQLATLGVASYRIISSLIHDAHGDDPLFAQAVARDLQPKWDDLVNRIARAAGE